MPKEPENKKCEQCGGDFSAKRSDARFCSANCRQQFVRSQPKIADSPKKGKLTPVPGQGILVIKNKKKAKELHKHPKNAENAPAAKLTVQIQEAPKEITKTYRDYLTIAPSVKDSSAFIDMVAKDKKLTPGQRSMIYSKVKK